MTRPSGTICSSPGLQSLLPRPLTDKDQSCVRVGTTREQFLESCQGGLIALDLC